ncbi:hypothetical protein MCUN1_001228 [Malassezia cuniculi]|uniref:Armadillo-like helical domain-containing protein n=1 Tax=Malassezia cuniculi TaxID=948313 RepID=A0AAF0ESP3_9BASI|nr:hypothetical protein MCUN1_001228 [Malassezia cuniculi]
MPPQLPAGALADVLSGAQPWDSGRSSRSGKSNAAPRSHYFGTLLEQPVDVPSIHQALAIPEHELLDERHAAVRENTAGLVREALYVWTSSSAPPHVRSNAVQVITAIAQAVLSKPFANYTLDAVAVMVGGMEDADEVFGLLVAALDTTLRVPDQHGLQRRALHLALVCVSCAGNSSLITYFLHRDLLGAALRLAETTSHTGTAAEAALLISLLATCNTQAPANAPVAVLAPDAAATALARAAAFQPYLRVLREHAAKAALGELAPAIRTQLQQIAEAYHAKRKPDAPMPPAAAAVLLPLWLLCHVSPLFCQAAVEQTRGEALVVVFLSLASYMLTHAATNSRSSTYAQLVLHTFCALLDGGTSSPLCAALLVDDIEVEERALDRGIPSPRVRIDRVTMCRDKANPLPPHARAGPKRPRRLIVAVLDCMAVYAKYNLSRRLDIGGHVASLAVVRQVLLICAAEGVQIEYDWLELWQAIINTAAFLAARSAELSISESDVRVLATALTEVFTVAIVHADRVLQTPAETTLLVYELARRADAVRTVVRLAGGGEKLLAVLDEVDKRLEEWRTQRRSHGLA